MGHSYVAMDSERLAASAGIPKLSLPSNVRTAESDDRPFAKG
jgi:hypothetical protein